MALEEETTHHTPDPVQGGSTLLILKKLAVVQNAALIIADAKTALSYRDHKEQGSLAPLNQVKDIIDQYAEILLPLKGEKKVIAEQIHDKNQAIDNQLIDMQKRVEQLDAQFTEIKKLKAEFETAGRDRALSLSLLEKLQRQSQNYITDVKQFNKQVRQVGAHLDTLRNEAKFHAPMEHQRRIEKGASIPQPRAAETLPQSPDQKGRLQND